MKAIDLYTDSVKNKIAEYNTNAKFNDFLYENKECNAIFTELNKSQDRFIFVQANNKISKDLTPEIHTIFHNKKCIVNGIEGVIEHPLTRVYEGRTLANETSFRSGIALWVNTGDRYSSHLYNVSEIEIL